MQTASAHTLSGYPVPSPAVSAVPARGWSELTPRELQVVALITRGATNQQAAHRLCCSPHTVSTHLRHVFSKLGITSRVELTRIAVGRQLH
jgi:DNA-binding CsgD family transcriptional regulator